MVLPKAWISNAADDQPSTATKDVPACIPVIVEVDVE
jgi:hypothetical protein